MPRETSNRLAQIGAVVGVALVGWTVGVFHVDGATAAEARYLTLVASWVLLALSVSRRTAPEVVIGAGLVAALLLMPAAEGTRGATVLFVLVAVTGWSSWRLVGRKLGWLEGIALAFAWQALLRSDRFADLAVEPRNAIWLLALPAAFGCATVGAGRWAGRGTAVIAAAALLPLTPGVGIVAVVVMSLLWLLPARRPLPLSRPLTAAVAAVLAAAAGWRSPETIAPIALMIVALLVTGARWRWGVAVAAAAWAVASRFVLDGMAPEGALAWLALALPAVFVVDREQRALAATAVAVGIAAVSAVALAPALALGALAIGRSKGIARWQAQWGLGVLVVATLAAAYPWWRIPARLPLPLFEWPWWALVGVVAMLIARLPVGVGRRGAAVAAVGALVLLAPGRLQPLLEGEPVALARGAASWAVELPHGGIAEVVVDSFLTAPSPAGGPAAIVRAISAGGEVRRWQLTTGHATEYWGAPEPNREPWLTWIAGPSTLARRYRAIWKLPEGFEPVRLEIYRAGRLAPRTQVVLLGVGTR